jgi:hypothetical protein
MTDEFKVKISHEKINRRWVCIIKFSDNLNNSLELIRLSLDVNYKLSKGLQKSFNHSDIYVENLGLNYHIGHFKGGKLFSVYNDLDISHLSLHSSGCVNINFKDKSQKVKLENHTISRQDSNNQDLDIQYPLITFSIKYQTIANHFNIDIRKWSGFINIPDDRLEFNIKYIPTKDKGNCEYDISGKKIWEQSHHLYNLSDDTSLTLFVNSRKSKDSFFELKARLGEDKKLRRFLRDSLKSARSNNYKLDLDLLSDDYGIKPFEVANLFRKTSYHGSTGIIGYDKTKIKSLDEKMIIIFN